MKNLKNTLNLAVTIILVSVGNIRADGAGTVALIGSDPSSARASALGEAFIAVQNDIAGMHYNPASLQSLEQGQAGFMYQKGLADDSYGHFMIGAPTKVGSLGFSFGYYDSGSIDIQRTDTGPIESVTAQKDMTMALGYAQKFGNTSAGITGKYLSSKLIDQYSASTFALDLGLQQSFGRMGLGLSARNLGGKLSYLSEEDSLPVMYGAGVSFLAIPGAYATTLLLDANYHADAGEVSPSAGIEVNLGLLAIRGGYQKTIGLKNQFTVGAGMLLGGTNFDYSFGMVDQLNSEHRVSVAMKFGGSSFANTPIVRKPQNTERMASKARQVEEVQKSAGKPEVSFVQRQSLGSLEKKGSFSGSAARQVYIVRPGDTLGKIAKRFYGDAKDWKKIYTANRHLLENNKSIEVGQKIVLP